VAVQISPAAISDTADAVFSLPEYNEISLRTPLARLLEWLGQFFAPLREAKVESPILYWLVVGTLALIVFSIAGRYAYLSYVTRSQAAITRPRWTGRPGWSSATDAWLRAQQEAANGNFTIAAHAMYEALLGAVARRETLRLHPSKTVGDYARELRARSSGLFAAFRDFARSYETVIYGIGTCDQERYERLRSLASPIVTRNA
jgi:hypothetical protein